MKVVILAGGHGTRISEETHGSRSVPKPMVEIGGRPILWHVMKLFSAFGHNEFVICTGYAGEVIFDYFKQMMSDRLVGACDLTFDFASNNIEIHRTERESWKVTTVDTGLNTMTGGRIKRVKHHLKETFLCTYGDGVADIDINRLVAFHRDMGKLATHTNVVPEGRFGIIEHHNGVVTSFREKHASDGGAINGGFFVLEPGVLDFIDGDATSFEKEPMARLVDRQELATYSHEGFWQCMDTLRDKHVLEACWQRPEGAPWRLWDRR